MLQYVDAKGASTQQVKEITVDSLMLYASAASVLFTKSYSNFTLLNEKCIKTIYDTKETISFDIKQTFISPYLENIYVEKENEKYFKSCERYYTIKTRQKV